ncbi:MAG: hypothetical protein K2X39_08570 [Silvanigrellaceae bacterium]|nr:hypothetical protein [Silvanigrellaceae bacterium]
MFQLELKKLESLESVTDEERSSEGQSLAHIKQLERHLSTENYNLMRTKPWKPKSNPLAPQLIDFNWLISQPIFPFFVQIAPPQLLYQSICAHGFEDSIEVIEWIRGKQLQEVLDYDLWAYHMEKGCEDISEDKFMGWLKIWLETSPEFAAERFIELEEETIVLCLSKVLDILPEGATHISEEVRENWWQTADTRFFLKVKSELASENFGILKTFIDALYLHDARLAGSILAYSAMLVREESLEEALRWRNARMADQGFVDTQEALTLLAPKKQFNLKQAILDAKLLEEKRKKTKNKFNLQEKKEATDENTDKILQTLSSLSPEDGIKVLFNALGDEEVKLIGGSNSVENLINCYDDNNFLFETAEKIYAKCEKLISYSQHIYSRKENENSLLIDKIFLTLGDRNYTKVYELKTRIARTANTLIVGAFSNKDNDNIERSLFVVRGFANIGLEVLIHSPKEYGIELTEQNDVENGLQCLDLVGIEFLFQVGWNFALTLQRNVLEELTSLKSTYPEDSRFPKCEKEINLQGEKDTLITVPLLKLWEQQRYADIARWLESLEHRIPNETFVVLNSVLNRVPFYPEVLSQEVSNDNKGILISQNIKAFERLSEVEKINLFIKNIKNNF